jgi:hypothetical protein
MAVKALATYNKNQITKKLEKGAESANALVLLVPTSVYTIVRMGRE